MPEISITTTQNVNINFNVANLGVRILANIVDGGIKLAYIIFMQTGMNIYFVIFVCGPERFPAN